MPVVNGTHCHGKLLSRARFQRRVRTSVVLRIAPLSTPAALQEIPERVELTRAQCR
jgi:hypothetical protein